MTPITRTDGLCSAAVPAANLIKERRRCFGRLSGVLNAPGGRVILDLESWILHPGGGGRVDSSYDRGHHMGESMPAASHTARYEIRGFDCDLIGRVHPRTLCLLLQESATAHAAELGVGVDLLIDRGIAWVLSQLKVEILRWPTAGEAIVVETWPEAASGTRTDRRFRMRNEDGEDIGRATTLWLIMDLERRRPTRLPDLITSKLDEVVGSDRPTRLDRLPTVEDPQFEATSTVGYSDLDMVHHANNAAFVQWMVESVAESLWNTHVPAELEVHYLAECRYGETILCQCEPLDGPGPQTILHRLSRGSDGTEAVRARTVWRPSTARVE